MISDRPVGSPAMRGRCGAVRVAGFVYLAALLLATTACDRRDRPERLLYSLQGGTFGTYYVVKIVADQGEIDPAGPSPEDRALPLVEEELAAVDRLMSTYRDDSELVTWNRARTTEPIPVSPATLEVFEEAVALGELTGGAIDVTVGPLVEAWGFGPSGDGGEAPDDEALAELLDRVGFRKLTVDAAASTVTKAMPDLVCDLSSLAKGYGVDRVLERLLAEGFEDVMVEIGGEVRTAGVNLDGVPWRLGIERPSAPPGQAPGQPGGLQRIVGLEDEALATSGDYRQYREVGGRRISHLIDPRTGYPIEHRVASVSVVDETCMRADALATALMVLGESEGFDLAERENVAALFVIRDGDSFTEKATGAFQRRFPQDRGARR